MKNLNLFLFAAGVALLTACGNGEQAANEPVVATYTLDTEASTLEWTGYKKGNEQGQHSGTINFADGTVETTDDVITSGKLTVDMNTISTTDQLPAPMGDTLNAHLKGAYFFDTKQFPTAEVTVGELKDGKLATTIKVTGMEFKQVVPVTTKVEGDKLIVEGKFDFDFEGIKSPGFADNGGTRIHPKFDYNMHLEFKK
ncbi:MAG TPA: YceI family protein [Taishania sp.]|nr:YceI family protein [Taishania sp.]